MTIRVTKKSQAAYKKQIEAAVSKAAGRDGVLSQKEAEKLSQVDPNIGEAAKDYFEVTGDPSVAADRLAKSIGGRVDRAIEAASDGREVDATKMPGHLAAILLGTARNHMPMAQLEKIATAFATGKFAQHTDFKNPEVEWITDESKDFDRGYLYEGTDSSGSGRDKKTRKAEDIQPFHIKLRFDHEERPGDTRAVDFVLLVDRRNGDLVEVDYGRGRTATPESYDEPWAH